MQGHRLPCHMGMAGFKARYGPEMGGCHSSGLFCVRISWVGAAGSNDFFLGNSFLDQVKLYLKTLLHIGA